jgi:hypothetical protein
LVIVGTVGIVSCHGAFLEAKADGEMHAGRTERDLSSSWIVWQIDWPGRFYALQNEKTQLYLSKHDVKCVVANRHAAGRSERWTILSGHQYGMPGRVALRAHDGTIMGSDEPGKLTGCGGEVMAADRLDPSVGANDELWPGWWMLKTDVPVVLVENGLAPRRW